MPTERPYKNVKIKTKVKKGKTYVKKVRVQDHKHGKGEYEVDNVNIKKNMVVLGRGGPIGVGNLPLGLTIAAASAAATLVAGSLNVSNVIAGTPVALVCTLPAAKEGTVLRFMQLADMQGGNMALSFVAATGDTYEGSQTILSAAGTGGITGAVVTSNVAGTDTTLLYTGGNAATELFQTGSTIDFVCYQKGQWAIDIRANKEGTGATGVFTFA